MQGAHDSLIFDIGDQSPPHRIDFVVVFVDKTECPYLRLLKRGFRHCFVALRSGERWLICDSLKSRLELSVVDLPADFDLSKFYYDEGHTVFIGTRPQNSMSGTIFPEILTCVAVVKRIIGLRSYWTLTPWRLFCLLNSMGDDWHMIGADEAG